MLTVDGMMDPEHGNAAGEAALAARRARGETMVYIEDGWVVVEYGDGHTERVCPEGEYRAEMVTPKLGLHLVTHAPLTGPPYATAASAGSSSTARNRAASRRTPGSER